MICKPGIIYTLFLIHIYTYTQIICAIIIPITPTHGPGPPLC